MIDAHTHLQDPRCLGDVEAILDRARQAGLTGIVVCGTCPADWDAVLDLAERHPQVIPMLGLHPWHVAEAGNGWAEDLARRLRHTQAGVGECGLDGAREDADLERQKEALRIQLRLARSLDRPVALHGYRAWGDLLGLLRQEGLPRCGGLVHAFSGSPEIARDCLDLGLHLSFGGGATRPGRAQHALRATPPERILMETDSPDQIPRHLSGMADLDRLEPHWLPQMAAPMAASLGMTPAALMACATRNAQALFRIAEA